MKSQLRPAIVSFLLLTVATGAAYPLVVTGIARLAFARQANGSVIDVNGRAVGSGLIGQPFTDPKYFWSRPSATSPVPYAAEAGAGSNLGPTNPARADAAKQRADALREADPSNERSIPVDLLTASASGLDPHVSIEAAQFQVERVARARHLPLETVRALVDQNTERRTCGVLGEPRVNVLKLNLLIDSQQGH